MGEGEKFGIRRFDMITPMLSDAKVDFRKERIPLPLLLDRTSEGLSPRSKLSLFKIPTEVLVEIVQYIEPDSLGNLALVNKDCRQLARSRQFASVLLDYSDSSISLVAKLISEGDERLRSPNGRTSQPSIGACIRRARVATNPRWVALRESANIEQDSGHDKKDGKRLRIGARVGPNVFFDSYLTSMMSIFSRREILPHIELLDWEDRIVIPSFFFHDLACSRIMHLKLFRILIDQAFKVSLPGAIAPGGWPLQTLHMEVQWNVFGANMEGSTASLCSSILRLCAPTLVSLTWENSIDRSLHSLMDDHQDPLQFPCLRHLQLGNILFSDSESLNMLLGRKLISLFVDTEKTPIYKQAFQNRGTIHSLETFVWNTYQIPADHRLDFLQANSQLRKLSLPFSAPPVLLETRLLPLLSSTFNNLSSLSLVWDSIKIPDSALQTIDTINTLQQIQLSAGCQSGWRHDWPIDHGAMRRCLSSLLHLRKIAFTRDSYDNDAEWSEIHYYYIHKYFNLSKVVLMDGENLASQASRNTIWERLHIKRMMGEVSLYVETFPKLEWMYIGQIPTSITKPQGAQSARFVTPLWAERNECRTLLRETFNDV